MIDSHQLDELLIDWHKWCKSYQLVSEPKTSAMFAQAKSSRQWDAEHDVRDGSLHDSEMRAIDFWINELVPVHRTAIQINARNLATGKSVWTSARLPVEVEVRQKILKDAREILCSRLG